MFGLKKLHIAYETNLNFHPSDCQEIFFKKKKRKKVKLWAEAEKFISFEREENENTGEIKV